VPRLLEDRLLLLTNFVPLDFALRRDVEREVLRAGVAETIVLRALCDFARATEPKEPTVASKPDSTTQSNFEAEQVELKLVERNLRKSFSHLFT